VADTEDVDALQQTDEAAPLSNERLAQIRAMVGRVQYKHVLLDPNDPVNSRCDLDWCDACMAHDLLTEVDRLRAQQQPLGDTELDEIRARNRYLRTVPFETHGPGVHGDNCPPCGMVRSISDVIRLLKELDRATARAEQAETITARVTDRMREYDRHGGGIVNIRQVLNLLSPTWPDGNYEAASAGGDRG